MKMPARVINYDASAHTPHVRVLLDRMRRRRWGRWGTRMPVWCDITTSTYLRENEGWRNDVDEGDNTQRLLVAVRETDMKKAGSSHHHQRRRRNYVYVSQSTVVAIIITRTIRRSRISSLLLLLLLCLCDDDCCAMDAADLSWPTFYVPRWWPAAALGLGPLPFQSDGSSSQGARRLPWRCRSGGCPLLSAPRPWRFVHFYP